MLEILHLNTLLLYNVYYCMCGNECENVSHVLWECSAYSSTRASFMKELQEFLEDDYDDFESLENVEKSSYVLGSELWESKFDGLLALVKEYIVDVWEIAPPTTVGAWSMAVVLWQQYEYYYYYCIIFAR